MKKQNKQTIQSHQWQLFSNKRNRKLAIASLLVILLGIGGYVAWGFLWIYNYNRQMADDFVGADGIRQLILGSIESLGRDAPLDFKTGDIYFPEAGLYLPRPKENVHLGYSPGYGTDQSEINIFDRSAVNNQKQKLLAAPDHQKVFEKVSGLQACSRGALLTYDKSSLPEPAHEVLIQEISLSNGKTLYTYAEKACPSYASLSELLKGLRPY